MSVILDTHTFLWGNMDDPQLSTAAREFIRDSTNEGFLSAASAWEIAIKCARGRLTLPEDPDEYVTDRMVKHHFLPLPVQISHALQVFNLPDVHQDSLDRLLVAQSQMEDIPILTADPVIHQDGVSIIW